MISTVRVWFYIHGSILLLASVWLVPAPQWQLTLFSLAILANLLSGISWKIWLLRIFPLLLILLIFQLIVTPFYRPLLQQLWAGNFDVKSWWPPISGLLRLGTPFLAITAFSKRLSHPELVQDMAALLAPLKWLGVNIQRVQMILPLALRFFPMVLDSSKQIRENLDLFTQHRPQEMGLKDRLNYWGTLYKSTFIQTLNGALQVGEALALRGWRPAATGHFQNQDWRWVGMSLVLGVVLFRIQPAMFFLWAGMVVWMGLCYVALRWVSRAYRAVT